MKKQDIVDLVHEKAGGTKTQAEEIVSAIFDTIVSTCKGGDEVSIAGFGTFSAPMRAARTARNPRTGETVQVAAKKAVKFKAAKAFKDGVN